MPEIAYTQAFLWFYHAFIKVGPWVILGALVAGAIYTFGWGSGYETRKKEELEKKNQLKREEATCQRF